MGRHVSTYIAPEQIRGEPVDGRADVYALGCVLHFALTGQVPYPRETDEARLWAHLHAASPQPSRLVPGVPTAFDEVVRRALEKHPDERPSSAGELGLAALDAAGAAPVRARPSVARRRRTSATAVTRPDGRGRRVAPTAGSQSRRSPSPPPPRARSPRSLIDGGAREPVRLLTAPACPAIAPATTKPPGGKEHAVPAPHVVRTMHVGVRPVNVEIAAGSAWIASTGTPTLDRVPLDGRHRHRGPLLGFGITDVTDRRGELWVTVAVPRQVVRIRASTGHPIGTPIQMSGAPRAIDAGEGAIWVAEQSPTGPDHLVEIDPHTATVVGRLAVAEGINDIRAANGAVWVLGRHSPTLIKVSPATRQPIVRIAMGRHAERVDTAAGYVWVTDYGDDDVTRVDPKGPKLVDTDVPGSPTECTPATTGSGSRATATSRSSASTRTPAASSASRSASASTRSASTSAAIRCGSRASATTG